jgi:hypothetical protein
MKRPPTIWLTQSLLLLFALVLLSVLLINLAVVLRHPDESLSLIGAVLTYSITLGVVVLFAFTFWGLARRTDYGRWLGLISLVLLWGLIIFMKVYRPTGPYNYYEYDNTAQLVGAVVFQVVLHALFLVLILRLAFSKKIRAFFAKKVESTRMD